MKGVLPFFTFHLSLFTGLKRAEKRKAEVVKTKTGKTAAGKHLRLFLCCAGESRFTSAGKVVKFSAVFSGQGFETPARSIIHNSVQNAVETKLEPKLIAVLREGYTRALFGKDLVAGIIVGIVALPLAIAFAIASGVKPEQSLYTAVIAGFIISALSGSRVQIGGPTGAFIVLIYEIVHQYGYD